MKELKCPRCGSLEIEYVDCLDTDFYGDTIARKYCGYCMKCDMNLLWEENYTFTGVDNIVEDD